MKKKYNILSFFFIFLTLFCVSDLAAKHIVGGDVTYRFISKTNNILTYEIFFTMYRDSQGGGAQFDANARFGLFRGNGNNWVYVSEETHSPEDIAIINIDTGNPCLQVPSGIGVQSGVYKFNVSFEQSETESFMIAYQRCCRNNSIFNLNSPEDTGAVFSTTISPLAQAEQDNSPTFDDFPPVVICANSLLNFDHSASDLDGDQIVYSFCTPLTAGGTDGVNFGDANACTGITPAPINCGPPFDEVDFKLPAFNFNNPLGNGVTISSSTGLISGVPQITGQFVVGVCATSFRNGVEIGRLSRDFQFNVTNCEIAVQANIGASSVSNGEKFIVNSCGDLSVDFVNLSTDASKIFSYDWELNVLEDTIRFNTRDISFTFPDTGRYVGVLFLNNSGDFDNCKDTAFIEVNIFPEIIADFVADFDTCIAGPIDFTNLSMTGAGDITKNEWVFEENEFSAEVDPRYSYVTPGIKPVKLTVEDMNECRDSIVKDVVWFPVPPLIIVQPSNFIGCLPASISFNNLSSPIDETYDVIWDFGDGTIVNELSPTHVFEDVGIFSVNVSITSPIGCEIAQPFGDLIKVQESPVAGFSFTPENPSIFNLEVDFIDESTGAISWLWNFGGIGNFDQNPTFTFQDTGIVEVIQVVTHPEGCTDTLSILLDIEPLVTLHLPNAFTPNNDGLNDEFKGKGFFDGFRDFEMNIWNRWGESIYTTFDPDRGWNGKKDNNGANSPVGVYVYTIQYVGPRGENNELKGHVTLIR